MLSWISLWRGRQGVVRDGGTYHAPSLHLAVSHIVVNMIRPFYIQVGRREEQKGLE